MRLELVLGDDLLHLLLRLVLDLVVPQVELHDPGVAPQGVLQSGKGRGVLVVNEVTADIYSSEGLVLLDKLSQALRKAFSQSVRAQVQSLQHEPFVAHKVNAEFLSSLIVDPVQFEVEVQQRAVLLYSLGQETGTVVFYLVVAQVQVCQDLRLKQVLGHLTRALVPDFVVRKIQLGDRSVEHEPLRENADQVIIDQVSGQA